LAVAVDEFLLRLEILPWNSEAAKRYAQLLADLEKKGEPMGNLDMMIAAQALASEAMLVTHDRVFRRVRGLKSADWTR
jgi:tRNA(fMet)-specific endonuclease VapC